MDDVSVAVFDKWPQLFFDYGPFFIVLVLMLVVARTIGKNLQNAIATNAGEANVRYWRWMFAGIWIFTGAMVIGTCVWWVQRRDVESVKAFVVRIDITDAQPTDVLEPFSDDLFYRNRDPRDAARRKDTFVAVAEKPFTARQQLEIVHRKGADATSGVRYTIPLDDNILKARFASFKLVLNEKDGTYQLKLASAAAPSPIHAVVSSAFAAQPSVIQGQPITLPRVPPAAQTAPQPTPVPPPVEAQRPAQRPEAAAAVVLSETNSVYRQTQAVGALLQAVDAGAAPNWFQRRGQGDETLLSYLITLSRHQDKLLSYKARTLLQRADYIGVVAKVASGKSGQPSNVDGRILSSLSAAEWQAVEERLRKDGVLGPGSKLAHDRGASPLPSATSEGTLYYGVTTWTSLSGDQQSCLANVVARQSFVPYAEPKDALGFVKSRKGFAFNFETKSEALVYADAATKCGAATEFLYWGDRKLAAFKE